MGAALRRIRSALHPSKSATTKPPPKATRSLVAAFAMPRVTSLSTWASSRQHPPRARLNCPRRLRRTSTAQRTWRNLSTSTSVPFHFCVPSCLLARPPLTRCTQAGLEVTPTIRNALKECEDCFMPLPPALRLPSSGLPPIFSSLAEGKAYLDNQLTSSNMYVHFTGVGGAYRACAHLELFALSPTLLFALSRTLSLQPHQRWQVQGGEQVDAHLSASSG